jgi:hypothetical protein
MTTSTTSQPIETPARTVSWLKPALLVGAGLIVAFLFFYNLTDYPKTWFDEGVASARAQGAGDVGRLRRL